MTAGDAIERDSDVQQTRHRVNAVHDTLRQAIADMIANFKYGEVPHSDDLETLYEPTVIADEAIALVLADPVVRRAFAITRAIDNEPEPDAPDEYGYGDQDDANDAWVSGWGYGYRAAVSHFRAAGKTT